VKVFVRAKLPDRGRRKTLTDDAGNVLGEVEMYSAERFFTVTGHILEGGAP
jgi:hypothetical protein